MRLQKKQKCMYTMEELFVSLFEPMRLQKKQKCMCTMEELFV